MHTKNDLLLNQIHLKSLLGQLNTSYQIPQDGIVSFDYQCLTRTLQAIDNDLQKNTSVENHFKHIEQLFQQLVYTEKSEVNNPALIKKMIAEIMIKQHQLINLTLSVIKADKKQSEYFERIARVQDYLEGALERPWPIDLANIHLDYLNHYEKEHKIGYLGLFKLPFKQFLQNRTREADISFIEKIDLYCNKKNIPNQLRNFLKQNALSIVIAKIDDEKYGQHSLLKKILINKLQDAHLSVAPKSLRDDFFAECRGRNITCPDHLLELAKKERFLIA